MNKLQKIIQTSPGDGVATLQELMSGEKDNRNLSSGMRKMIDELQSSPWYSQGGNLYWIRLQRMVHPRLSQSNNIRWFLIRPYHQLLPMTTLDATFREKTNDAWHLSQEVI